MNKYLATLLMLCSYSLHAIITIEREITPKKPLQTRSRAINDDAPAVVAITDELPVICRAVQAQVLLDLNCLSDAWVERLELDDYLYIGVADDPDVIADQRQRAAHDARFLCLDVLHDPLPKADIVFCHGLFEKLGDQARSALIKNIHESGAELLLVAMTNAQLDRLQKGGCAPLVLLDASKDKGPRKGLYALWLVEDLYTQFVA